MDKIEKKYNKTVERLLERERMQERTARVYREKFRDKIVRFFAKIYRFVEKSSRKTREEKVSKKHVFKPFQNG